MGRATSLTLKTVTPDSSPSSPSSVSSTDFARELSGVWDVAYRVALRMCGNSDDAADILQDSVVAAYTHFESYQRDTNFKAWFLKILTNRALNFLRRSRREVTFDALPADNPDIETDSDDTRDLFLYQQAKRNGLLSRGDDPAERLMEQVDGETIQAAINKLAPDFRAVVVLCLVEEVSYEDAAALLDIPLGTVRSRLHRGRKMLQKILWEQFGPQQNFKYVP